MNVVDSAAVDGVGEQPVDELPIDVVCVASKKLIDDLRRVSKYNLEKKRTNERNKQKKLTRKKDRKERNEMTRKEEKIDIFKSQSYQTSFLVTFRFLLFR